MINNRIYNSLNKIQLTRSELIELVSNEITERFIEFNESIDDIINKNTLDSKSYHFIKKSQKSMNEIIKKIKESKSSEEITKLRNKFNYHINKIKRILKDNNLLNIELADYFNELMRLRNSISIYLRVIKRNIKLTNIAELIKSKLLTEEEKEEIRKIFKNERRFNSRWIKHYTKEEIVIEEKKINTTILTMIKQCLTKNKINIFSKTGLFALCIALFIFSQSNSSRKSESEASNNVYEITEQDMFKVIDYKTPSNVNNTINMLINNALDETNYMKEEPKIDYEMMSEEVRRREIITIDQLDTILNTLKEVKGFESKEAALEYLYNNEERTYEEKMLVVMTRENLRFEQLDIICAGVIAEGGTSYYDEAYRVASVLYNRCHSTKWTNTFGFSLYEQFTAPTQFAVYTDNLYQKYMGNIDLEGYQAALDMFYSRITSVDYLSFRSKDFEDNGTFVQFMSNGNKYTNLLKEEDRIESDYMEIIENELNNVDINYGLVLKKETTSEE